MADRNAANVLPEPVGATTSVWFPAAMEAQAPICAPVGAANEAANHSRTSGENGASGSSAGFVLPRFALTPPFFLPAPTVGGHVHPVDQFLCILLAEGRDF